MPMDRGTPDLVRHCVAAVAKQYGGDVNKAFAICVAQLQKAGYLKPDSMELTSAGKKKEAEHEAEPDAGKKMKAYEKLLKQAREGRKEESYDDLDTYLNPRTLTGLEDAPRALARKYETVSKGESSMDFMRRMAGISTRYEDRAVRAKPVVEGLEMKVAKALEDAGFDSHDFHFEDGLIAQSLKTAYEMAKTLAKSKQFGSVTVEPLPKGRAKLVFSKSESSMAAVVKHSMSGDSDFSEFMQEIGASLKGHVTNLQNEIADAKEKLADLQDAWEKRDWEWLADNDFITRKELQAIERGLKQFGR